MNYSYIIVIWLIFLDYKVIYDIMEIPLKQEGSFINYKIIIKNEMINNYSAVCTIRGCYVCELIQH